MGFIIAFIALMFALDALWCAASLRVAKPILVRLCLAMFCAAQMAGLAWLLTHRFAHSSRGSLEWKFALSALFLWHMMFLPLFLIVAAPVLPIAGLVRTLRALRGRERPPAPPPDAISRRQFVCAALALTPPLLNLSLATVAAGQLQHFRLRRFVLPIPELPVDLDGITIAQVSDMHVGRFTSGRVLGEMVRVVNELRADLVLLTGDLINDSLADLEHGINLVRSMQARTGIYLIEGNHDLIENGAEFERRVRNSGVPFLRDESATVTIRGARVQLLGLSWTTTRVNRDAAISASVRRLLLQREPGVFPILLAHHPHAFDAAAEAAVPLTLSGHTHGGQLMLNEGCGFGPALFRYWSGLYQKGASRLIVSNGVGNWFPLRVRAPAELLHITLKRAGT